MPGKMTHIERTCPDTGYKIVSLALDRGWYMSVYIKIEPRTSAAPVLHNVRITASLREHEGEPPLTVFTENLNPYH